MNVYKVFLLLPVVILTLQMQSIPLLLADDELVLQNFAPLQEPVSVSQISQKAGQQLLVKTYIYPVTENKEAQPEDQENTLVSKTERPFRKISHSETQFPMPRYPKISRLRGDEGTVVLKTLVDENGNPIKIQIRQSSGHEELDRAAEETVWNWKFKESDSSRWLTIPINFSLKK